MIEDLLHPISEEKPCGEYPYAAKTEAEMKFYIAFQSLETLLAGKLETDAKNRTEKFLEPKWEEVKDQGLAIFKRCKHLQVAVALTLAWLRLEGLPGFRDGLALLHGLLDRFWDSVHPLLDPEDNNDPTERVNLLAALCNKAGEIGDRMQFAVRLRQAPLCRVRGDAICALDLVTVEGGNPNVVAGSLSEAGSGQRLRTSSEIKALFAEAQPEEIGANHRAIEESLALVHALDAAFTRLVEPKYRRSWTDLIENLEDIKLRFSRFAPVSADAPSAQSASPVAGATAAAPVQAISGGVRSRADVRKVLEMACDYYKHSEPSSPIPLLLRRAIRLLDKDFLGLMQDLNPDALGPLQVIVGTPDNPAPGA